MAVSCEELKNEHMLPEKMVNILQDFYKSTKKFNNIEDNQCDILINYIDEKKEVLNKMFTPVQSKAFWEVFDDVKKGSLKLATGELLKGILAYALSRDVDLSDPKIQDSIEIYTVGLNNNIIYELINSKSLCEVLSHMEDYDEYFSFKYNLKSEYDKEIRIGFEKQIKILKIIEEKISYLFMWGPTTESKTTPEYIMKRLFKGVSTVSISKISAHGAKDALPLAAYLHDIFHYSVCFNSIIGSLGYFIFNNIMNELSYRKSLSDIIDENVANGIKRFNHVMSELSKLYEYAIRADDHKLKGAMFYIFHEGGSMFLHPEDWNDYLDIPKLLSNIIQRINNRSLNQEKDEYSSEQKKYIMPDSALWNSCADDFDTCPLTGEMKISTEQMLLAAKKSIAEFVEYDEKKYLYEQSNYTFAENLFRNLISEEEETSRKTLGLLPQRYKSSVWLDFDSGEYGPFRYPVEIEERESFSELEKLKKSEKEYILAKEKAAGVKFDFAVSKRFVQLKIQRNLDLEAERVLLSTTLYHKRRNAWDLYWLLGSRDGTDLARPDELRTRDETITFLANLYNHRLPKALDHTVSESKKVFYSLVLK